MNYRIDLSKVNEIEYNKALNLVNNHFFDRFLIEMELTSENKKVITLKLINYYYSSSVNYASITYNFVKKEIYCMYNGFSINRYNNEDGLYFCYALAIMYNENLIKEYDTSEETILKKFEYLDEIERLRLLKLEKEKTSELYKSLKSVVVKNDILPLRFKAHLIPEVTINFFDTTGVEIFLSLKVGIDKFYKVPCLYTFNKSINNNEEKQYGKSLIFKHGIENFDDKAKKLIEYLSIYFSSYNKTDVKKEKEIKIDYTFLDRIIDIFSLSLIDINIDIESKLKYIELNDVFISNEKTKLDVEIKNYKLKYKNEEENIIIPGKINSYILQNNVLKTLDMSRDLIDVLLFTQNNDFSFEYVKDDFNKEIYSRIYNEVKADDKYKNEFPVRILKIESYFDKTIDGVTLETKYYLDNNLVTKEIILNDNILVSSLNKYESIINNLGFKNGLINDTQGIALFITSDLTILKEISDVYLSESVKRIMVSKMSKPKSVLGYNSGMLSVCFEDLNYSDDELYKIYQGIKKKVKFIKLTSEKIVEIDEETSKQFLNTITEFDLDEKHLSSVQDVPLYQSLKLLGLSDEILEYEIDDVLSKVISDISNFKKSSFKVPKELDSIMRDYQKDAFKWMKTLIKYNFCGILADDMGLGKTLEVLSVIQSDEKKAPTLIVCPKSLCYNWKKEVAKWTGDVKTIVISGISEQREAIIKSINNNEKVICITGYDSLRNDIEFYSKIKFRFTILDEAQFIKNHTTLKAQSVKKIKSDIRFVLTGTPIENTVVDLWSLFDFLMPNYLYNYSNFKREFEKEITQVRNEEIINLLVKKITPFILRRTKKDVLTDLPDKVETVMFAEMTKEQRKYYEAQVLKTKDALKAKSKIEILSQLTRLRQLCVDPGMFIENYNYDSGKINLLMDLIDLYLANDHKLLIFSQFTSVFETIEAKLKEKGISYFLLTGKTAADERVKITDEFNSDESTEKVFLISLKAGGTGLNLVGADTVIHLDPWWNISAENQATDRTHRIGQKRVVEVIKLVCENSIEQKVIELQELKKQVINDVIANNDENIISLSPSDLSYLLS